MLRAKEHKKSLLHEWYHRQEYFMATLNRETRSRKDFSRHGCRRLGLIVFHMTLQDEYAIIFNPHRTQRSRPSRKLLGQRTPTISHLMVNKCFFSSSKETRIGMFNDALLATLLQQAITFDCHRTVLNVELLQFSAMICNTL